MLLELPIMGTLSAIKGIIEQHGVSELIIAMPSARGGAGAGRLEPAGFGFDDKTRFGRNTEAIEIIKRCWTEDTFDHDGKYWQLRGVQVVPRPVQKPHPPIYFPALNPKAMDRNARFGYGANMGHPTGSPDPGFWKQWHTDWDAALRRHGRTAAECPTSYFLTLFVTEDPERAWAKHRESFLHVEQYYARVVHSRAAAETREGMANLDKFFLTPADGVKLLPDYFGARPPATLIPWGNRASWRFE